jgi:single-strand DNA-binding protein
MSLNNLNHVTATGYLARDPELRDLPSGHQICEMYVACNNRWHNKLTGKWDGWTDYFNVRVFGALAPIAHRRLHKGSGVAIDGRLTSEPARCSNPEHRSEVLILAEHMQFIENVSVNPRRRGGAAEDGAMGRTEDGVEDETIGRGDAAEDNTIRETESAAEDEAIGRTEGEAIRETESAAISTGGAAEDEAKDGGTAGEAESEAIREAESAAIGGAEDEVKDGGTAGEAESEAIREAIGSASGGASKKFLFGARQDR